MRRTLTPLLCLLLLPGCYTVRFYHSKLLPEGGVPREQQHHGLLNGLVEVGGPVQVEEACPSGVYAVENEVTLVNAVSQTLSTLAAQAVLVFVQRNQLPNAPGRLNTAQYAATATVGQYVVGRHFSVWDPSTVRIVCARGAARSTKMAVLKLVPRGGVETDVAALFTEGLVAELRRRPGISVLTESDMTALLGLERQKQLIGCTDESCLAEIGGALGVDRLVHGSVGKVGSSLVLYLTSLDPRRAQVVGSVSERLKSEEGYLDALPGIASHLLMETPASEPPAPAK